MRRTLRTELDSWPLVKPGRYGDDHLGMDARRAVVVLALLIAGCGEARPDPLSGVPSVPPSTEHGWRADAAVWRRAADEAEAAELRRRAALKVARRSHTVAGALRRAYLARHVSRRDARRLLADYVRARDSRLTGARGAELSSVVTEVERLAAARRLTAGRFPAVFLLLRRNYEFWSRSDPPPAGFRTAFGRDPAVFQYYPGRGLQIQQLASWGRVNAVAHACLNPRLRHGRRCPRAALRAALDRMVELGARRDRFLAWEYYFSFGGGTPPWVSGMTQGTAIQALARGARVLHRPRYVKVAERALGAFERPPPIGVDVAAPGGRHYLMYSFNPGLRILNGDLQAITGLRDLAVLGHVPRAARLFRAGERAARLAVRAYDTGAWSLYSQAGRESTLGYHQLVAQFLGNLCTRTARRVYCSVHRHFARYEREPPRIRLDPLRGLWARRSALVRFSLSKVSTVDVQVRGRRGVSLDTEIALPRGIHTVWWTPPARGRYRVRIVAQGPSGPRGVLARTVRVVLPRPARPRRCRPRRKAHSSAARPPSGKCSSRDKEASSSPHRARR
jgi:D-glucuronyl C5-epimerase C-terminus